MDERICLVTGATSGIGLATAARLAQCGVSVIAVGGSRTPREAAEATIRAHAPGARLEVLAVDLSDMTDVRRLADHVLTRYRRLDVLLNIAGRASAAPTSAVGEFDPILATNHLGPFLLTNLLLDLMKRSAPARIITVTSSMHRRVREIPWRDLQQGRSSRRTDMSMYTLSKLLNILFTSESSRRLRGDRVAAMAADPGFVRTRLDRDATGLFGLFLKVAGPFRSAPEAAALDLGRLALSADADEFNGRYVDQGKVVEPSRLAQDTASATRLWDLSAALTGIH